MIKLKCLRRLFEDRCGLEPSQYSPVVLGAVVSAQNCPIEGGRSSSNALLQSHREASYLPAQHSYRMIKYVILHANFILAFVAFFILHSNFN